MIQMAPVLYEPIMLAGGLDLVSPTLNLKPGVMRDCVNFEVSVNGGYTRVAGYERYDGHARPSDASFGVLFVAMFTNTPAVGNTITNGTATGYVIYVGSNFVVYTKSSGSFAIGDAITVGATPIGTAITPPSALTARQNARYTALAADAYRSDIAKPTGSGAIRGVFVYNDVVYCMRDNAGAGVLYKSTGSGWSAVTLFEEVSFSNANTSVGEGDTLTQGGVTATIKRVVVETGTLVSGTNTGRLIIDARSGGNYAAGAASSTGGGALTLGGAQTAITLSPGGKCEVVGYNFFGQASGTRVYVADGVNRMWEFDGTTLVPLNTNGLIPKHVAAHKKYLFYSVGSSIFYRSIGDPYLTTGGAEIAVGDDVTGMIVLPGAATSAALGVFTRNGTNVLYGTGSSDWNLVSYNFGTGALPYSQQNMAEAYVCDDRGVFGIAASLNFGNFEQASLTNGIQPFINAHRTSISASTLCRAKSQYRLFYSDGYGLYLTIVNGKFKGVTPVQFPTYANVAWESTKSTGEPIVLIGGGDGMVYEMERGTSFDGESIGAYFTLNWDAVKNPRILKRLRKSSWEVSGSGYAEFNVGVSLGYGSDQIAQDNAATYAAPFQTVNWDAFTWDAFTWDGKTLGPTEVSMSGTGENFAVTIASNSTDWQPFTINSGIVHYTPRRGLR